MSWVVAVSFGARRGYDGVASQVSRRKVKQSERVRTQEQTKPRVSVCVSQPLLLCATVTRTM